MPATLYGSPWTGAHRYHATPTCTALNSYAMANLKDCPPISRAEITRRGLTPCKVCTPAPILTAVPQDKP